MLEPLHFYCNFRRKESLNFTIDFTSHLFKEVIAFVRHQWPRPLAGEERTKHGEVPSDPQEIEPPEGDGVSVLGNICNICNIQHSW